MVEEEDENWYCAYIVHKAIETKCELMVGDFTDGYDEGWTAGQQQPFSAMVKILHYYDVDPIWRAAKFDSENEFEVIPEVAREVEDEYGVEIAPHIDSDGEFQIFSDSSQ